MKMVPTLSVITICFNNLQELQGTCDSIDSQSLQPLEHIIIDGSNNKEIFNWLTTFSQPPYRKWIHEKDEGISDAFNKGLMIAKGKITHLLNSGDKYINGQVLQLVLDIFAANNSYEWLHGQYIQHRGEMDVISGKAFQKELLWRGMRTVAHPTMFIKKTIYDKYGFYNKGYKIAMDYDMLVRIRNEKSFFISTPLVAFAPGGVSNTNFSQGSKEVKAIYNANIGTSFKLTLWQLRQRVLNSFMKTFLGQKWFQWKNINQKA